MALHDKLDDALVRDGALTLGLGPQLQLPLAKVQFLEGGVKLVPVVARVHARPDGGHRRVLKL